MPSVKLQLLSSLIQTVHGHGHGHACVACGPQEYGHLNSQNHQDQCDDRQCLWFYCSMFNRRYSLANALQDPIQGLMRHSHKLLLMIDVMRQWRHSCLFSFALNSSAFLCMNGMFGCQAHLAKYHLSFRRRNKASNTARRQCLNACLSRHVLALDACLSR